MSQSVYPPRQSAAILSSNENSSRDTGLASYQQTCPSQSGKSLIGFFPVPIIFKGS